MTREEIEKYLRMLGDELLKRQLTGEIIIVGGAFMLLALQNRETTRDIDAYFVTEPAAIRDAARVVADREGLASDWLNDGVKGFFYTGTAHKVISSTIGGALRRQSGRVWWRCRPPMAGVSASYGAGQPSVPPW